MNFLPDLPAELDSYARVALLLIAAIGLAELGQRLGALPRLTGYVAAGILLGPGMLAWAPMSLAGNLRPLMLLGLGLLLFELGSRVDLRWLRHNPSLIVSSLCEAGLTFAGTYFFLKSFDFIPATCVTVAAIGIHHRHDTLVEELRAVRDFLCRGALALNLELAGGGTHPFQHWAESRIPKASATTTFRRSTAISPSSSRSSASISTSAARRPTRRSSCSTRCRATCRISLRCRRLRRFQGRDTRFASARLNSVFTFPLSGRAPLVESWEEFGGYFEKMTRTGVVKSMKDFYWDIRPKPEYGTIEVRVCDTPLTVEHAADLAAYLQALCRYLMVERPLRPVEDDYLVYTFNRFQACRFGCSGVLVDPRSGEHRPLCDDILQTLALIEQHAIELGADAACRRLMRRVPEGESDAEWCRRTYAELGSLPELMRAQARKWTAGEAR